MVIAVQRRFSPIAQDGRDGARTFVHPADRFAWPTM
ncbi:hypothetical protein XaFJ1_GM001991 [Xanthomonas albilineans]|nr:hypothetical protein XaFJ1_GM001991 [Xanthomonas albilineans]